MKKYYSDKAVYRDFVVLPDAFGGVNMRLEKGDSCTSIYAKSLEEGKQRVDAFYREHQEYHVNGEPFDSLIEAISAAGHAGNFTARFQFNCI